MAFSIPPIQGIDLAGIDRAVTQNKLAAYAMKAQERQDATAAAQQNALAKLADYYDASGAPEKANILRAGGRDVFNEMAKTALDPKAGFLTAGDQIYDVRGSKPVSVAGGLTLGPGGPPLNSAIPSGTPSQNASMSGAASSPPGSALSPVNVPEPFKGLVQEHADRTGLPYDFVARQMAAESAFDPRAVSNKGAEGLMQILPGTAASPGYGVAPAQNNTWEEKVRVGADYSKAMHDRYQGNSQLALAAYNWGPRNVDSWLAAGADPRKLPTETQAYISRITGRPFTGLPQSAQSAQAGGTATDATQGGAAGGAGGATPIMRNGKPFTEGAPQGTQWGWNGSRMVAMPIPGAEDRTQTLSAAEVKALGLPDGTLAQRDAKGKITIANEGKAGPVGGSGLDSAMYNIVLSGDPSTPEYAAAYARLTQPKPMMAQAPDGSMQMMMVTPQLPAQIRKPTGGQMAQQPGAAGPGVGGSATAGQQQGSGQEQGFTVTPIPGMVKDPKFSEGETNAYGFANRMQQAEKMLSDLAAKGYGVPTTKDLMASAVPVIGNRLTSSDYQQLDQAKRNFINALLRKESGAAIAQSEFDNADKQYFPQPGNGPAVIAQKAQNRATAIQAMMAAAQGPQKFFGGQQSPPTTPAPSPAAPPSAPASSIPALPPGFQILGGQ